MCYKALSRGDIKYYKILEVFYRLVLPAGGGCGQHQ